MKTRRDIRQGISERVQQALANPRIRKALEDFAGRYAQLRLDALEGRDFERIRVAIASARDDAVSRREELHARFCERLEALGAVVHHASDAAEARRIVCDILKDAGARRVVKSKSITTEEIGLNDALLQAGIRVTETDLGEWIIQLAGQKPSHIIIPAIHMDRREIAALLSQKLGESVPVDIDFMVRLARRKLRQEFLNADAGITGANMAIAEDGTLVVLSNEGNAGLTTALPPLHVAVVGIDKIVADWTAALAILDILPRSATGQLMSSYVSFYTGPPVESQHVVLLDNGRSEIAESPEFRQILRCIRCGACLNVCPVYQMIGGQAFSRVYMGGIGTILTAFLGDVGAGAELARLCAGCRSCATVCPAGIDIPLLVEKVTQARIERRGRGILHRAAFGGFLGHRRFYHAGMRAAGKMRPVVSDRRGMVRAQDKLLPSQSFRDLPALSASPLRDSMPHEAETETQSARLFAGCLVDFVYPESAHAARSVLSATGVELVMPGAQGCCGIPAHHFGDARIARKQAVENLEALDPDDPSPILTLCPTCLYAIRHLWPALLVGTEDERAARRTAARAMGISKFLAGRIGPDAFSPANLKVAYHVPCHVKNQQDGEDAIARRLLASAGCELVDTGESRCCGFAGPFSLQQAEISSALLKLKLDAVEEAGAEAVATDCPGCVLQIRGGAARRGMGVEVLHTVELLARALAGKGP